MKNFFIYLLTVGIVALPLTNLTATAAGSCKDVQFVFARGSGTPLYNGNEWRSFSKSVHSQLANSNLSYDITDLDYPAISVDPPLILIGAYITAGKTGEFAKSISTGAQNLVKLYNRINVACPSTRWVFFGYSQGSKVLSVALSRLNPDKVIYVATFGDPNLYLPEGVGFNPPACRGQQLSNYRIYAPDCDTDNGILGARKPYTIPGYSNKTGLWCNDDDLACGSSKNLFVNIGHLTYDKPSGIPSAVYQTMQRIKQIYPNKTISASRPYTDLAILIDATGSMLTSIKSYTAEAARLAKIALAHNGRVALYIYRDLQDGFKPLQLCDFSCTLSDFTSKLKAIEALDGGDNRESLLNASLTAMNTLYWRQGATKSVIVLTDAGFHNPDRDGTTLQQVVNRSLEIDPVNIFVISHESAKTEYPELTDITSLTGGKFFNLNQMTASTDYVLSRPVAILPQENYSGLVGDTFHLDASMSYGVSSPISHYDWDLDGDGTFELTNHTAIVEKSFHTSGEHFAVVRVVASDGASSTMSAKISISTTLPQKNILAAPTNLVFTPISDTSIQLSWQPTGKYTLIVLDDVILGYTDLASITIADLDLASNSHLTLTSLDHDFTLGQSAALALSSIQSAKASTASNHSTTPELKAPDTGYQPKSPTKK